MVKSIRLFGAILIMVLCSSAFFAQAENNESTPKQQIDTPLYKPFIERYILDELKQLRTDLQALRAELATTVADARLDSSDRAIRYTADTVNNIFYIITASASLLVLFGWRSLQDIKSNVKLTTEKRVDELTLEYEERLNVIEAALKERSEQIVAAQKDISDSAIIHSLWMRAGLEKTEHEKIRIFDQILEIRPNDVEALTYKADTLLDLDEDSWALSLANQALDNDGQYAMAYWQRACAEAKLEQNNEAIEDIRLAIELSKELKAELSSEVYFENIKDYPAFIALTEEGEINEN